VNQAIGRDLWDERDIWEDHIILAIAERHGFDYRTAERCYAAEMYEESCHLFLAGWGAGDAADHLLAKQRAADQALCRLAAEDFRTFTAQHA
jgi:hypothetical protein